MPSYFPENNEPKPMDSSDRSLQKINSLLTSGAKTKPLSGEVIDRSGATTGTSSQEVMPVNESRTYLVFQNISDTTMYVNFGALATTDTDSIKVNSGGSITFNGGWVPNQVVNVICSSAGKKWVAKEGV